MKLIRFGPPGIELPGILLASGVRKNLSAQFLDWDARFFREDGLARLAEYATAENLRSAPDVPRHARWAAPISRPSKVVCVGLNYSDHAIEAGQPIPPEPILFLKAPNTMIGPYDPIQIPPGATKTDWEIELAIVIGRGARRLASPEAAQSCVAGYCISNDVSERAFQLEHGSQWTKGKSCDTFLPLGPWVATPDEIPDPGDLPMTLKVNDKVMQQGHTSKMIFGVDFLIWHISQFMTLEPGDLISTGTPAGVGGGMKPPRFLRENDEVQLEIQGLGQQRSRCVAV
jgi:2-keto-4-pentenoate hydratase/2-oxohepta-3-ene-1,7-dioic acid hydratase in catechol pathway